MPGSRTETGLVKFQRIRGERGDTIVYFLLRRYCAAIKRKTRVILYIKREKERESEKPFSTFYIRSKAIFYTLILESEGAKKNHLREKRKICSKPADLSRVLFYILFSF